MTAETSIQKSKVDESTVTGGPTPKTEGGPFISPDFGLATLYGVDAPSPADWSCWNCGSELQVFTDNFLPNGGCMECGEPC